MPNVILEHNLPLNCNAREKEEECLGLTKSDNNTSPRLHSGAHVGSYPIININGGPKVQVINYCPPDEGCILIKRIKNEGDDKSNENNSKLFFNSDLNLSSSSENEENSDDCSTQAPLYKNDSSLVIPTNLKDYTPIAFVPVITMPDCLRVNQINSPCLEKNGIKINPIQSTENVQSRQCPENPAWHNHSISASPIAEGENHLLPLHLNNLTQHKDVLTDANTLQGTNELTNTKEYLPKNQQPQNGFLNGPQINRNYVTTEENTVKSSTNDSSLNFETADGPKKNKAGTTFNKNCKEKLINGDIIKNDDISSNGILKNFKSNSNNGKVISTIEEGDDVLLPPNMEIIPVIQVYKSRFWILLVFSTFVFMQTVVFGTFGPITASAQYAFGWEDSIIAVLQCWGPLSVILFIIPATWFNETYGLRKGVLTAISFMSFGTLIRCFTSSKTPFTVLSNIGAICNGIAGCIGLSLPAVVAATWFPLKERTTATAIGALAAQLGGAGMYLSPLIVRSVSTDEEESSLTPDDVREDIMTLIYIHFSVTVCILLCAILYFPNKPLNPPTVSSATLRHEYFPSIRELLRNKQFMLVLTTYAFSFGIPVVWIAVMNFSLQCIGVTQEESMWVAIIACIVSAVFAFITARITDYIYGYLRVTIMTLLVGSSIFFLWFLLLVTEVIPPSIAQIYVTVTGGISLEYATVPLLIELGVEIAYPSPESVVGALMTGLFNVVAAIFLLLFIIPSECYHWVTFVLVGCTSLTVLPLILVKETHNRSSLDRSPN